MYECAALSGQRRADDETTHLHGLLHATRPTVERPVQTHRDEACIVPLTPDRPQACEPRCADVFKHYLACADRIEQKGAGTAAASEISPRVAAQPLAAHIRHRRDRTTKKTRRRLRALLLRLAQVHRQVRDAAHHAEAQVDSINISYDIAHVLFEYFFALPNTNGGRSSRLRDLLLTGDDGGGAAMPRVKAKPAAPGFSTLTHKNK